MPCHVICHVMSCRVTSRVSYCAFKIRNPGTNPRRAVPCRAQTERALARMRKAEEEAEVAREEEERQEREAEEASRRQD